MDVFYFRRLRVYQLALRLVRYVYEETRQMPPDARPIVWQLVRAASSVALNIAEGCGEYSPLEKARFFRMARRSSWEAVGALDTLGVVGALEEAKRQRAEDGYTQVGAMLTALVKNQEGAHARAKREGARTTVTRHVRDEIARETRPAAVRKRETQHEATTQTTSPSPSS